jgi:hypothetical protein
LQSQVEALNSHLNLQRYKILYICGKNSRILSRLDRNFIDFYIRQAFTSSEVFFRKNANDCFSNILKPSLSLVKRASHHYTIGLPVKILYTTKAKDAVPPESIQGIAEYPMFSLWKGIGCVKNYGFTGLEQPLGDSLAIVSFQELVSHTRPDDPIYPTLENCRRIPHQLGWTTIIPFAEAISSQCFQTIGSKVASLGISS